MKIAGGEFKGRILKTPKNRSFRPSTEKIREAIFSVLGADVVEALVADLFCGSGALGLEALSRGAKWGLFVDSNPASTALARQNVAVLGLAERAKVMTMNAFLIRPSHLEGCGIIFADPPYGKGHCERLASLLCLPKFSWSGILVLEHESTWHYAGRGYRIPKRIDMGDTSVSFLLRSEIAMVGNHG